MQIQLKHHKHLKKYLQSTPNLLYPPNVHKYLGKGNRWEMATYGQRTFGTQSPSMGWLGTRSRVPSSLAFLLLISPSDSPPLHHSHTHILKTAPTYYHRVSVGQMSRQARLVSTRVAFSHLGLGLLSSSLVVNKPHCLMDEKLRSLPLHPPPPS